jgi:hypothetical protein
MLAICRPIVRSYRGKIKPHGTALSFLSAAYPLSLLRFFSKALWQSPVIVLVHADRRTADIQHDTPT